MRSRKQAEKLVEKYLPATYWAVRKFVPAYLRSQEADFESHRSVALQGLWRAALQWRKGKGANFTTFAANGMRLALSSSLAKVRRRERKAQSWNWGDLSAEQAQYAEEVRIADTVQQYIDRDHLRQEVEKMLNCKKLNDQQRQLGRLLWIEGLTPREAADRMGLDYEKERSCRNSILLLLKKVYW